jgi:hypothetical protein
MGDEAPPVTTKSADQRRDEREYATQSEPDQPPPVADERARRIAETSPEGIPADPGTDHRTLSRLMLAAVVLLLTVALAVAVFADRWIGLAVGVLGLFLLIVNPALWAAILRVKEREQA